MKDQMNIVFTGHVDHGKSTVVGRLLAETNSLPEGKLEKIKKDCERNSKPFEYAFLLDALKDEQSQGITIDAARVFFSTQKRDYIIIDAPGHIEFLKNMITGAARAEAAFLVIDADEGVQENSRRHGYLLSMLGIRQMCVVVNKMDLVNYDKKVYRQIEKKYRKFLKNLDMEHVPFIPVSGREGDNIAELSSQMDWYSGKTLQELLDDFKMEKSREDMPFRLPVQDIYKFTNYGDSRRIIAGTIDTGTMHAGDELVFYPSGKRSRIKEIQTFQGDPPESATAGECTGFTTTEQIYVRRGDLAAKVGDPQPQSGTVIRVSLFWLGKKPLEQGREYFLKVGTDKVRMQLFDTLKVINSSSLSSDALKKKIDRHDVAECVLTTQRAVAFDLVTDCPATSRFVIVDDYEIAGGGIIREVIKDVQSESRESVFNRNYQWDTSEITAEERHTLNEHKPAMILISGEKDCGKNNVAKDLEKELFNKGIRSYYVGLANVLYGMDADLSSSGKRAGTRFREEHLRRLAELSHIMLDAGMVLIVTAPTVTFEEKELIKLRIKPAYMKTLWVGDDISTDLDADYQMKGTEEERTEVLKRLKKALKKAIKLQK